MKTINFRQGMHFEAPEGAGDTHSSLMHGTLCDLIIRQGREEGYKPAVFIKSTVRDGVEAFSEKLEEAVGEGLAVKYPGLKQVRVDNGLWTLEIPEKYKVGREAYFGQVAENFLLYLVAGKLPEWKVPDMIFNCL